MNNFFTSEGIHSGALYGYILMLTRIEKIIKPDYVVACFDLPKPTFRHASYDKYKAFRAKTDNALIEQIKEAYKLCEVLNIPIYQAEGYEADDILGTIVKQLENNDIQVFIASGDMDTMQLVKDNQVLVYTFKKGNEDIIYDEELVKKKYELKPQQIPDYKGLAGDASDNISGVPGIGEKTAKDLLKKFETLENLYNKLKSSEDLFLTSGIKPRIINLLKEYEEEAFFSKTLATIRLDAPIDFKLPKQHFLDGINKEDYEKFCDKWQFKSLKKNFFLDEKLNNSYKIQSNSEENFSLSKIDIKKIAVILHLLDSERLNLKKEEVDLEVSKIPANNLQELYAYFENKLKQEELLDLYKNIEEPIIEIVDKMHEVVFW
jgi:5'-3' exonuclease (including N-terminal domain of PolI)